jgi:hypothetical protein
MWAHSAPEKSKVSRWDTWQQVKKTTGKTPLDLRSAPKSGPEFDHCWHVYGLLSEYTFTEIDAYCRMTSDSLLPWETEAIVKLAKFREVTPTWPLK